MKINFVLRLLRDGKIESGSLTAWSNKTGRSKFDPVYMLQNIFASRIFLFAGIVTLTSFALVIVYKTHSTAMLILMPVLLATGLLQFFVSWYLRFRNGSQYWESVKMFTNDYLLFTAIYHLRFVRDMSSKDILGWTVNDLVKKGYRVILANGLYPFGEMREKVFYLFYPASIQIPMTPNHVHNPEIDRIRGIIERFDMRATSL